MNQANVTSMRLNGDVTNCLFYGLTIDADPDKPQTVFGPANGVAVCSLAALPDMAAAHVSAYHLMTAKWRYWMSRVRRYLNRK